MTSNTIYKVWHRWGQLARYCQLSIVNCQLILLACLLLLPCILNAQIDSQNIDPEIAKVRVTLRVENAPLSSVLRELSDMSGAILYNQIEHRPQPFITIELKDVPFKQALQKIVQSVGLVYRVVQPRHIYIGNKTEVYTEAAG